MQFIVLLRIIDIVEWLKLLNIGDHIVCIKSPFGWGHSSCSPWPSTYQFLVQFSIVLVLLRNKETATE